VWFQPPFTSIVWFGEPSVDYLTTFANRVRRLRETAGLSIQDACDRGGISANFWGKVERGEQEPCLLSIGGIAQGLGISLQVLMTLEERPPDNAVRGQINNVLDLCNPAQWELSLRIVKAIHEQRPTTTTSLDQTAL
jgi:transcriptional regulator with XRE-family HTH domain